jgi:hypothetical protein
MRWTRLTLVITEAFVELSAFGAGAMFVVEAQRPADGHDRGHAGAAVAAWAKIRRWPPRAGWLSVVAGVVLAGWIAVQVAMIGVGVPVHRQSPVEDGYFAHAIPADVGRISSQRLELELRWPVRTWP